jgi:hypothetical protein
VKARTTERFWKCFSELPQAIRKQPKEGYKLFQTNPYHPGLRFKRIHSTRPIFSVRITKDYRAIGIQQKGEILWLWIGSHSEYDKLIKHLRNA